MNYIGISSGFHDAGLSVVDNKGNILFAGHSERYSKKKHDSKLCPEIANDAKKYINDDFEVHYYERPYVKAVRQFFAGQRLGPLNVDHIIGNDFIHSMENHEFMQLSKVKTHSHHLCHAAAGFQTSPYQDATVVVIDAVGELDTVTIWDAHYDKNGVAKYKRIWGKSYPDSIGLFYSAMTHRVGLRPLDEEYILMGMAAYGKPKFASVMRELFNDFDNLTLKTNLHVGVDDDFAVGGDNMDIASSAQLVVEELIEIVMSKAKQLGKSNNLVYGGGVALNCLANRNLGHYFTNIWIMPNPGDAGNSLGAAALGYGKKIKWTNAFLGYDIVGDYPVDNIIKELYSNKIVGVANGRAEFGPRALGNRSLLADPRGPEIKDKVNEIKRRQQFRPFAPIILEEHANEYFDMPSGFNNSRYMQVIAACRHPDLFPAITHHDGTSRVQTVPKDNSGIRHLLERWYKETGCPMLLNTSLNIRGEPMVNDIHDAVRFTKLYGVTVCS